VVEPADIRKECAEDCRAFYRKAAVLCAKRLERVAFREKVRNDNKGTNDERT
jgi:hypothetical protein